MTEEIRWVLGGIGTIALVFLGIWWKVEARQDKKIDDMRDDNSDAHGRIHDKIDDNHKDIVEKQFHILGKIEEVWKHMKNGKKP